VLSEIGVTFQKDGTMAVDSTKLKAAVSSNLSGVAGLFCERDRQHRRIRQADQRGGGQPHLHRRRAQGGFGRHDGLSIKQLDQQFTDMKMRVDAKVDRYRTQFTSSTC
jgi:flagellar hook-associated protein 2